MKKIVFFLLILWLFASCVSKTNEIFGTVMNKSTESVVENVQIAIEESGLLTETDKNGQYKLTGLPESDYTILYIHQDYDTLRVHANEMETGASYQIDVVLNPI